MFNADPLITVDAYAHEYWENGVAPKLVAPQATVSDDNQNFAGGNLSITAIRGSTHWDRLTVHSQGDGPGQISLHGRSVTYGGAEIGTLWIKAPAVGTPYIYKVVNGQELRVFVSNPPDTFPQTNRPAIVMIHGGGWNTGAPGALNQRAEYLASRGMVVVLVEYRLMSSTSVPPLPCIADVKSSIRWVRAHAGSLGINPNRIAAYGSSVGGEMAAQAGMVPGFDDPNDDLSISSRPNALALSYPTVDNGPGRWGYGRMGDLYDELGPAYNVSSDDPPTVAFIGGADIQVPADVSSKFANDLKAAGVRMDDYLYPGRLHGFDYYTWDNPYFYDTLRKTDQFFISLGWLSGQPTLTMPTTKPVDTWQSQSTVVLNDRATPQAVQALMRNIVLTVPDNPGTLQRRIEWKLKDGAGGVSNIATSYTRIVPNNDAPKLSLFGTAVYARGAPAYVLAPGMVVSDMDSYTMTGASFTISSTGAWHPNDRLEIQSVGWGPRQVGIWGNNIYYEGTQIGSFSGGAGNTPLHARFNDYTRRYMIEAVIRSVSFRTGTDTLLGQRTISYVVDDGNTNGTSKPAYKYVQVE